jgi:hypothetical protein
VLKQGGRFLLTIPYGKVGVAHPLGRTYDSERLGRLLAGWIVLEKCHWHLDNAGKWFQVPEQKGRLTVGGGVNIVLLDLLNDGGSG